MTTHTHEDFDRLSWHDCHLWGMTLRTGDPAAGNWSSQLVFDLDFIVDWMCGVDAAATFRVAPAELVFHDVTDLRIDVDWGDSGHRLALHDIAVDRIERVPVSNQQICLDRPYYRWRIVLSWPRSGELSFGASGFTQTLSGEPVVCDGQHLQPGQRRTARV